MRQLPIILAVPLAMAAVISLPMVQLAFIPLPGEMEELIAESRAEPSVPGVVHEDIVYARNLFRRHRLDVYEPLAPYAKEVHSCDAAAAGTGVPADERPDSAPARVLVDHGAAPVVIFFHGGSWIHGDKVTIRIIDRFLTRMRSAGYFVIAVNYTTSVFRGLSGPLGNVNAAIRWAAGHSGEFGYDRQNIGLYGVSAGGHLALMAASTMVRSDFRFAFVFAECAPSDLVALRDGEAFEHSKLLGLFPERVLKAMSPVRLVGDELPPVLLFHGGADQVVSIDQSKRYARAAASAGVHVEFEWYPEGDHGFLNLPDDVWYQQETRALQFFSEQFANNHKSVAP